MNYINALEQELCTAKTYEHNLFGESSVFDRHLNHMAAKYVCLLMRIIASFLR